MNPFDLTGPEFLLFYVMAIVLTASVVRYVQARNEDGPVPKLPEVDPYLMACLRGGQDEAIRLAVVTLVDRKLLTVLNEKLTAAPDAVKRARRMLEKAILAAAAEPVEPRTLVTDEVVVARAHEFEDELERLGLVANDALKSQRSRVSGLGMLVLWLVAGAKIAVAVERGHSNVGLLLMLAVFVVPFTLLAVVSSDRLSGVGRRTLSDMQALFSRLLDWPERLAPGSYDLTLAAGLFGIQALPVDHSLVLPMLIAAVSVSDSSSGDGGSSCGSSCGGGCGGGCGGCGS